MGAPTPPDPAPTPQKASHCSDGARVRAFADLVRLPLGGGQELVYSPFTRSAHTLGAEEVQVLSACRTPGTLDELAARFRTPVRPALERLVTAGLLVDEARLRAALDAGAEADHAPSVGALAIPTCDRPDSLHAALESYLENARAHGRAPEVLVADDSIDADGRARNREAMRALAGRFDVRIGYAGDDEKRRYLEALAAHGGFDPDDLAFALTPCEGIRSPGGNRNAILLHSAGDLVVMVDDDTRCALAEAPGRGDNLVVTSQGDPTELWWPEAGAEGKAERDFLSIHEELLGRAPGACARGREVDLGRASGMFFRRLAPGGGRVVTTQMGSTGDSGTGSMLHYLLLSGPSRARLLGSEAHYRRAFEGRVATRAARRSTIVDGGFCMSMCLGLDNRTALPPFPPVPRNGDGVFGLALRASRHDAYQGFLPWLIEHTPPSPRSETFAAFFEELDRVTSGDLLATLVLGSRVESDPRDPARGMRALGATLARWAGLPQVDFEEIVRINVLRARSSDVATLLGLLEAYRAAPAFWARDAERAARGIARALERPEVAWPRDLGGPLEGRARLQRLVGRYGRLLQVWPDVVTAARELRARGVRLASSA